MGYAYFFKLIESIIFSKHAIWNFLMFSFDSKIIYQVNQNYNLT